MIQNVSHGRSSSPLDRGHSLSCWKWSRCPWAPARADRVAGVHSEGGSSAQRPEIEVEVLHGQSVLGAQVAHAVVEEHEGRSQAFFLFVGEVSLVDAVQGLSFHELAQQFHESEDELHEVPFDGVAVGADPPSGEREPLPAGGSRSRGAAGSSRKARAAASATSSARLGGRLSLSCHGRRLAADSSSSMARVLLTDGNDQGAQGDAYQIDVRDGQHNVTGEDDPPLRSRSNRSMRATCR